MRAAMMKVAVAVVIVIEQQQLAGCVGNWKNNIWFVRRQDWIVLHMHLDAI
jgi:hypothetical protein